MFVLLNSMDRRNLFVIKYQYYFFTSKFSVISGCVRISRTMIFFLNFFSILTQDPRGEYLLINRPVHHKNVSTSV